MAEIANHLQLDDPKNGLATMIELSIPGFRRAPIMARFGISAAFFESGLKTRFSVSASASAQSVWTLWPWRAWQPGAP
jgi:hypothetical protein